MLSFFRWLLLGEPPNRNMPKRWRKNLTRLGLIVLAVLAGWCGWLWFDGRALRQAESAYGRSDWPTAYDQAVAYLTANPTNRPATLVAARALARMGKCQAASDLFARVSGPDPDDVHLLASCFVRDGTRSGSATSLGAASGLYRHILERRPADAGALQTLAAIDVQLGRPAEAVETSERLAEIPTHARAAHVMLGTIYSGQGNYAVACDHLEKVLELDPDLRQGPEPPEALWGLVARSLLHLGRAEQAQVYVERLLAIRPDAEAHWLLGHARQQQGDLEGASTEWQLALKQDSGYLPALRDLAELSLGRHDAAEALVWLDRAAKVDPRDATTEYRLGLTLRELGRTEDAQHHFEAAERLRNR